MSLLSWQTAGSTAHLPRVCLVIESLIIPSWKGPVRIITSNSWLHVGPAKKAGLHTGMNIVELQTYFAWVNEAAEEYWYRQKAILIQLYSFSSIFI